MDEVEATLSSYLATSPTRGGVQQTVTAAADADKDDDDDVKLSTLITIISGSTVNQFEITLYTSVIL